MKPVAMYLLTIQVGIFLSIFFYNELSCTAELQVSPSAQANHRPRFRIPKGNLSYYRTPQWEILYYLKHGKFPFQVVSSPNFNRTHFLKRIRLIKSILQNGKIFKDGDFVDDDMFYDESNPIWDEDNEKLGELFPVSFGDIDALPIQSSEIKSMYDQPEDKGIGVTIHSYWRPRNRIKRDAKP